MYDLIKVQIVVDFSCNEVISIQIQFCYNELFKELSDIA